MNLVLLRDDDANATTPPEHLERLYRPFLARGFPVNLSVIPEVRCNVRMPDGRLEGFLHAPFAGRADTIPIARNRDLVTYLLQEPGYRVAQHGLHHDLPSGRFEFDRDDLRDLRDRIERGLQRFEEAGLPRPCAFVAPQDRLSRAAIAILPRYFRVISGSWYSLERIPVVWWPAYLVQKKVWRRDGFRIGGAWFLSHPGCRFRPGRDPDAARREVLALIERRAWTVVVLHHWEFFRADREDAARVRALHAFAEDLASRPHVRVVSFQDLFEAG